MLPMYRRYLLPHGPSHGVGLNVHDFPGAMTDDFVLRSRMVITIEPGIYFYKFKLDEAREDSAVASVRMKIVSISSTLS